MKTIRISRQNKHLNFVAAIYELPVGIARRRVASKGPDVGNIGVPETKLAGKTYFMDGMFIVIPFLLSSAAYMSLGHRECWPSAFIRT
jgi:hypothetical protein